MNIDALKDEIYCKYKGKTLNAYDLYEEHHASGLYCRNHYSEPLRRLVEDEKIIPKYTDNKNHIKSVIISKECILNIK